MYAAERQQEVVKRARRDGRVEVKGLAQAFGVTPETVRRDLTLLEKHGLLRRAHGGAIPIDRLEIEPAVAEREDRMVAQKEQIALAAIQEVPASGAIILDAGTTTSRLAQMLPTEHEITVVTHCLPIAMTLASRPNITLHLLGGRVRDRTFAAVGPWTKQTMSEVFVDVAFLGANGITLERGVTTPDLGEAEVKRALVAGARRTVLLADHSKFGRSDFALVARVDEIDMIITDSGLDTTVAREFEVAGSPVLRA